MKYSLSNRLPRIYLRQADEIKVDGNDIAKMFEYIDEFPDKEFVLCISRQNEFPDIEKLKAFNKLLNGKFTCELENLHLAYILKENNIKFYWKYAATSFYELKSLKDLGVSQVLINAPLFFSLDKVKSFGLPIRIIPHMCYEDYIPKQNGLTGTWVRPEDEPIYDEYITTYEFKESSLTKTETLFDIYRNKKKWVSNSIFLFKNLNLDIYLNAMPDEVITQRLNCGQKCMENSNICNMCNSGARLIKL